MSNTSHRRVAMAAGVWLAGAAIPLAAAGTAWADETPGQAVAEARAAEKAGIPVEVSINGKTVKSLDTCGTACSATSEKGGNYAVAIGAGSDATDNTGDKKDLAVAADGGDATLTNSTSSKAFGTDGGVARVEGTTTTTTSSTASATGSGSEAFIVSSTHGTATATDAGNGTGTTFGAIVQFAAGSSATAVGPGSLAAVEGTSTSEQVTASNAFADNGGFATIRNDGAAPSGVTVTLDFASASGTDSRALVGDSQASSLVITNGENYNPPHGLYGLTDTHLMNP